MHNAWKKPFIFHVTIEMKGFIDLWFLRSHGELDRLLELIAFLLFGKKIRWPTLLPQGKLNRLFELVAFPLFGGKI